MVKIIRFYNQNRKLVWLILIIAIFCIAIISLLNKSYKKQAQKNLEEIVQEQYKNQNQQNASNIVDYYQASQQLTSGQILSSSVSDEIQARLEEFIQCVCSGKVQQAYTFLTKECKEIKYPSVESFERLL